MRSVSSFVCFKAGYHGLESRSLVLHFFGSDGSVYGSFADARRLSPCQTCLVAVGFRIETIRLQTSSGIGVRSPTRVARNISQPGRVTALFVSGLCRGGALWPAWYPGDALCVLRQFQSGTMEPKFVLKLCARSAPTVRSIKNVEKTRLYIFCRADDGCSEILFINKHLSISVGGWCACFRVHDIASSCRNLKARLLHFDSVFGARNSVLSIRWAHFS